MAISYTYMKAIGIGFPEIGCRCNGDGNIYENIVLQVGEALPSKETLDAWIDARIRSDVWDLIKEERNRRMHSGVQVGTMWFDSDYSSRIQQLGLVMLATNIPEGLMWKTLKNEFIEMTPTIAAGIFQNTAAWDITVFAAGEQKKAELALSLDPANYDYLTGWPTAFTDLYNPDDYT